MSYTIKNSQKISAMLGAVAIALGVQGAVLIGFDQLANTPEVAGNASQIAAGMTSANPQRVPS